MKLKRKEIKESKKVISRKTLKEWWGKEKMSKEKQERIENIFDEIVENLNEPVYDNEVLDWEVKDKELTRGFDVCLSISSGKQPFGVNITNAINRAINDFEKDTGEDLVKGGTNVEQDFRDYMEDWYSSGNGYLWTISFKIDRNNENDGFIITTIFTDGWGDKMKNEDTLEIKDSFNKDDIREAVSEYCDDIKFEYEKTMKESPNRHFHNSFTDYSEDFTDYYVVNGDIDKTAYSLGIWMGSGYYVDRFLCFADNVYDAIDMTLNYMWDNKDKEKFVIYDYEEVKKMAEDNLKDYDEEYNEMREEYDELEEEYQELLNNTGKMVDNWSHFRELENKREDLEYKMDEYNEKFVDKEIEDMWESDSNDSLYVYRENFRIDETPKDIAEEILRQVNEEENPKED